MPIYVKWYDEKQAIMIAEFVGKWTWDDYANASTQVVPLAADPNLQFDFINDFRQSTSMPDGEMMKSIGKGVNITTSQLRIIVAIKPPLLMESLIVMLQQSMQRPKRVIVNTMEEALAAIADFRRSEND